MKMAELKNLMEATLEKSKSLLLRDGKLVPVAFIKCANDILVTPLSFEDNDKKNQQLRILRGEVKKKNADAAFLVTESWYITSNSMHISIEPSKHPMRKECIMMIGECEDGNISMMQIFEHNNEKIIFGEKIDMNDPISTKFEFGIRHRHAQNENLRNLS